jgi:hypothetical protein
MDMKNVSPSPHESEAQAAKWYAIGRIVAIWTLPTIAFLALLIKLVWPQLQQSAIHLLLPCGMPAYPGDRWHDRLFSAYAYDEPAQSRAVSTQYLPLST